MEAGDLRKRLTQRPRRIELNSGFVGVVDKPESRVIRVYPAAVLAMMNIGSMVPLGEPAQP